MAIMTMLTEFDKGCATRAECDAAYQRVVVCFNGPENFGSEEGELRFRLDNYWPTRRQDDGRR